MASFCSSYLSVSLPTKNFTRCLPLGHLPNIATVASSTNVDDASKSKMSASTDATVYSSVQLRERDKLISEKHQTEMALLERKLQKVKSISDETAKQLFDAVNRGRRLAQSLGFDDVYDAQFAIDSVDQDVSFHECYDRLHRLDGQLSAEKEKRLALETKLGNAEGRAKELQTKLEARTSDSRCSYYLISIISC